MVVAGGEAQKVARHSTKTFAVSVGSWASFHGRRRARVWGASLLAELLLCLPTHLRQLSRPLLNQVNREVDVSSVDGEFRGILRR